MHFARMSASTETMAAESAAARPAPPAPPRMPACPAAAAPGPGAAAATAPRARVAAPAVGRAGEGHAAAASTLERAPDAEGAAECLPEAWSARELEDATIAADLRRLMSQQARVAREQRQQAASVPRMRSRALQRRRPVTRRARSAGDGEASSSAGDQRPAGRLTPRQQEALCGALREWQRLHEVREGMAEQEEGGPEVSHTSWAQAAGLSEPELVDALRAGPAAANRLLRAADGLLHQAAAKCLHHGQEMHDVLFEAQNLWLEAAARCDFTRSSLNTFGSMYVRQRLARVIDENGSLLQQAPGAIQDMLAVRATRGELVSQGRRATPAAIATELGLPEIRVANLLASRRDTVSMQAQLQSRAARGDAQETTVGETIAEPGEAGRDAAYGFAVSRELQDKLTRALETHVADATCREMCILRYGLHDGRSRSLAEVGERFGMSREAARKRMVKTLAYIQADEALQAQFRQYVPDLLLGAAEA